jgi:hypothetical protein
MKIVAEMTIMKITPLCFLSLFSLALYAADDAVPLPPDAQAAIDKADKSIASIQADADTKINKVRQSLATALKRCQDAAMQKKDLDGATSIKTRIDALNDQITASQPPDQAVPLPPEALMHDAHEPHALFHLARIAWLEGDQDRAREYLGRLGRIDGAEDLFAELKGLIG